MAQRKRMFLCVYVSIMLKHWKGILPDIYGGGCGGKMLQNMSANVPPRMILMASRRFSRSSRNSKMALFIAKLEQFDHITLRRSSSNERDINDPFDFEFELRCPILIALN